MSRRKILALLAVLVLCAAAPALARGTASWQKYRSPDGAFSILLPRLPLPSEMRVKHETLRSGPVTKTSFKVTDPKGGLICSVSYQDSTFARQPGRRYASDGVQAEYAVKQLVESGRVTLRSMKPCTLNGYVGREFEAVSSRGFVMRGRVHVVDKRLYVIAALCENEGVRSNALRFLTSLHLAKKK